jgi:hypothetical protein
MLTIILCSMLAAMREHGVAQEATPAAADGLSTDPSVCQVEPRATEDLLAIWYGTDATDTTAFELPAGDQMLSAVPAPIGEPVDAETAATITAVIVEAFACFNAGDFARAMAHASDSAVLQLFGPEPGLPRSDAEAFLGFPPEPFPAGEQARIIAITDVSMMLDGRIGAIVVSDDPVTEPAGIETEFLVLVDEDGRWVVDEYLEFTVPTG